MKKYLCLLKGVTCPVKWAIASAGFPLEPNSTSTLKKQFCSSKPPAGMVFIIFFFRYYYLENYGFIPAH